ncbi:MAG TPA: VOC family protein [Bacteroidia bacterium]
MKLQKITPFLWFNTEAADAANFYITVFKNAKILSSNPMVTAFELEGLQISALNGGPTFKLNESFSLMISCDNQEEIDYYWNKLTADGGQESQCGWLKDKFGLSWQVVPSILPELMSNPATAQNVMQAFMKMKKFDIATLEKAAGVNA